MATKRKILIAGASGLVGYGALRHFGDHADLGVAAPSPRDEEHAGVAGDVGRERHRHAGEDHDTVEWNQPEVCHTWNLRLILEVVNHPAMNYTVLDEARDSPPERSVAAPGQAVLRPAGEPPPLGRRAPALACPVSRAPPDRAGATHSHGAACRDPRLRRVERHGARGPARIPRSRASPPVGRGPPGEGTGPHPHRLSAPRPPPRSHDGPAGRPRTPLSPRRASARADPQASTRVKG